MATTKMTKECTTIDIQEEEEHFSSKIKEFLIAVSLVVMLVFCGQGLIIFCDVMSKNREHQAFCDEYERNASCHMSSAVTLCGTEDYKFDADFCFIARETQQVLLTEAKMAQARGEFNFDLYKSKARIADFQIYQSYNNKQDKDTRIPTYVPPSHL